MAENNTLLKARMKIESGDILVKLWKHWTRCAKGDDASKHDDLMVARNSADYGEDVEYMVINPQLMIRA